MSTVSILVQGMSCISCVARIKKTLMGIQGVSDTEVKLADKKARVRFDPSQLTVGQLVNAISDLGYAARLAVKNIDEIPRTQN